MREPELSRAIAAARSTASAADLAVQSVVVLQNSTRVIVHLLPCDIVARIAPIALQPSAEFEVALAQQLVAAGSPVARLDARVEQRVHVSDGVAINFWTHHATVSADPIRPADMASAFQQFHAGMREVDLTVSHVSGRISEARSIVSEVERSPGLSDADRGLLIDSLGAFERGISEPGLVVQRLHGEPHPGNILNTSDGPLFIDLETCCVGPIEFDIAHAPPAVGQHYPGIDQAVLDQCRGLILAMVASWRWDRSDEYPDGLQMGRTLVQALRGGPPWPSLATIT